MITNIDHQLGRLFGYLQLHGLWDDLWVIYTTDHGEHLGDHYDIAKSSFYNSAARLPFLIYFVQDGREQLFDHVNDPNDLNDLASAMPDRVKEMRQHLVERLQAINSPDRVDGQLWQQRRKHQGSAGHASQEQPGLDQRGKIT